MTMLATDCNMRVSLNLKELYQYRHLFLALTNQGLRVG
jgi:hypothetical protein